MLSVLAVFHNPASKRDTPGRYLGYQVSPNSTLCCSRLLDCLGTLWVDCELPCLASHAALGCDCRFISPQDRRRPSECIDTFTAAGLSGYVDDIRNLTTCVVRPISRPFWSFSPLGHLGAHRALWHGFCCGSTILQPASASLLYFGNWPTYDYEGCGADECVADAYRVALDAWVLDGATIKPLIDEFPGLVHYVDFSEVCWP